MLALPPAPALPCSENKDFMFMIHSIWIYLLLEQRGEVAWSCVNRNVTKTKQIPIHPVAQVPACRDDAICLLSTGLGGVCLHNLGWKYFGESTPVPSSPSGIKANAAAEAVGQKDAPRARSPLQAQTLCSTRCETPFTCFSSSVDPAPPGVAIYTGSLRHHPLTRQTSRDPASTPSSYVGKQAH